MPISCSSASLLTLVFRRPSAILKVSLTEQLLPGSVCETRDWFGRRNYAKARGYSKARAVISRQHSCRDLPRTPEQNGLEENTMARRPTAPKSGAHASDATGRSRRPGPKAKTGTTTGRRSAHASATPETDSVSSRADIGRLLREAFLRELATIGWRDLSFADVVSAAGVSLSDAYQIYQTKTGVLRGVVQATDQAVLESLTADPLDGSPRDRLFDLIMRRLDQHRADKAAFSALLRDLRRQPAEALCLTARLERSMALTLDLAAIPRSGLRGAFRTKALAALYLHVLGRWLKDDSEDSASTMALLDKRLDQAEHLLGFLNRARSNRSKAGDDAASNEANI
jgi:ubiquinone biosynthesis protein COQ9